MNLVGVLEGLLFVVGDEGVTLKEICEILNVKEEEAKDLLINLNEFDLLLDKNRKANPKNKKTDWFFKNEKFDRGIRHRLGYTCSKQQFCTVQGKYPDCIS